MYKRQVYQFTNTSVARFPLAVARQEKIGEETKRISASVSYTHLDVYKRQVIDLMTNYFKWQMTVPDDRLLEDFWERCV